MGADSRPRAGRRDASGGPDSPPADDIRLFQQSAGSWLKDFQQREHRRHGRVRGRRLTNLQLERTLHDLLGVDIPLASRMPEDQRASGFSTVTDAQQMSHFQLARHVDVVDAALDEAFRRAIGPPDEWQKPLSARQLARTRERTREPELIDGRIVVWSSRLIFYGRLPATRAEDDGWYRFHIRGIRSLKTPADHGVWCTIRSGPCVSSAPLLAWIGSFEATEQPQDVVVEAWLPEGHMLEVRPGDRTLKQASFKGGQAANGEGNAADVPGLAIDSIAMERIHRGPDNQTIRRLLFGELPVEAGKNGRPALISDHPHDDALRLLKSFATRAFRRPADDEQLVPYQSLVAESLDAGASLLESLRTGYRALLCSPRFLYLHEEPGTLDGYAVASRLSYLLWNSLPDERLASLAEQGRLGDPQVLRSEVDRMLADRRGRNFVRDFAHEWLELSEIDFTEPDTRLHRDFDIIVQNAMLDETHTFLQTMLDENLGVRHLIDSDFTFLNSRLARYYEIEGVEGDELRRVPLRPEHHRGGVLTQGAILKVTANGTATSPVIRGVWVCERLLGLSIPPPPENVPAIEPDIRGAKTIRDLLAKHRSDASCAACHVKIDPPGFALENYDAAGRWRERYQIRGGGRSERGPAVDAGDTLLDGRSFENIDEFRALALADPRPVARNVAEKLLTYGTGATITFADRDAVQEIVTQTSAEEHGLRSILKAVVASPIFLSK